MSLLNFLKRKKEEKIDLNGDLKDIISHGILFEDTSVLLKWGSSIKDLSKVTGIKEKRFADRVVYNWGEHTILKGLKLELTTTYWYHQEQSSDRLFKSLCFLTSGDIVTKAYFDKISAHVESQFGAAGHNNIGETEIVIQWLINGVRLYLRFYKQYNTDKVQFEISVL